jgi:hypothetical protein
MVPMILEELYLPLSLRGDEGNIGGHQKKERGIEKLLEQRKNITILNITVLWG